jgi:hypothetical protein
MCALTTAGGFMKQFVKRMETQRAEASPTVRLSAANTTNIPAIKTRPSAIVFLCVPEMKKLACFVRKQRVWFQRKRIKFN